MIAAANLDDRLLFASNKGVAEWVDGRIVLITSTFEPVAMFPGMGRVFFTKPAPEEPYFVEFDPRRTEDPWWGYTY